MISVDKNDVDISKLFRWGNEFKIYDNMNNELLSVYIRLVGDAELNRARVFALRKSAELRKKLKDEESDEYYAYIPQKEYIDKEVLIENILLYMTREITLNSFSEIKPQLPVEPGSDASLEKQEQYQKEVDEFPKKREALIRENVVKVLDRQREELKNRDLDSLYNDFIRLLINQLCEDEMLNRFKEMSAYLGTYKDSEYKERLFKSFDDFENLPQEVKSQFLENYSLLEISGEDLKKLQEVTQ